MQALCVQDVCFGLVFSVHTQLVVVLLSDQLKVFFVQVQFVKLLAMFKARRLAASWQAEWRPEAFLALVGRNWLAFFYELTISNVLIGKGRLMDRKN